MVRLLAVLAGCFLTFTGNAQITFRGRIIDSVTHQPLEGASISEVSKANNKAVSVQFGYFYFKTNSKDPLLIINHIGYKTLLGRADTSDLVFKMQPEVLSLKDVTLQVVSSTMLQKIVKVDLDLKPVRNTQELLRIVPGLFIAQHAGGGKAEQIFLRGFDCDHGTDVDVNFDGIPVNMVSHAHGQGYADSHFIIPETINTIDYGAGPYYTLHGNLNTAGYVSFSTYRDIPQSRIQIEAGRFNTFRTLAMIDLLKRDKDKQSAYVAGDFYYTDGPTLHKQNFNRFNLFAKYNLALSERSHLTISGSAFKSKWDASGQIP